MLSTPYRLILLDFVSDDKSGDPTSVYMKSNIFTNLVAVVHSILPWPVSC